MSWKCSGWRPLRVETEDIKLLPCLCGGKPTVHRSPHDDAIWISCDSCGKVDTFSKRGDFTDIGEIAQRRLWNVTVKKLREKKHEDDLRSGKLAVYTPKKER